MKCKNTKRTHCSAKVLKRMHCYISMVTLLIFIFLTATHVAQQCKHKAVLCLYRNTLKIYMVNTYYYNTNICTNK